MPETNVQSHGLCFSPKQQAECSGTNKQHDEMGRVSGQSISKWQGGQQSEKCRRQEPAGGIHQLTPDKKNEQDADGRHQNQSEMDTR